MKSKMSKIIALCLVFALVFTLFAGCGDKSSSKNEDKTSSDTIKIGCILPFTGGSAYLGKLQKEGLDYCVDYYNSKGGINGKKIEIVYADSTGVPDVAVTELERMVNNEHIVAITGPYNSTVAISLSPIAEKYQIPFVIMSASALNICQQGYKYTFRPGNTTTTNTEALIGVCDLIEKNYNDKINDVGILYENSEWGKQQEESFKKIFTDAGKNIVFDESFENGAADFSSSILKLKKSGAKFIIPSCTSFSDAVLFTRQLKEYKCTTGILATGGVFVLPEFLKTLGDDANYIISTDTWNPDFLSMRGDKAIAIHQGYIDKYGYKMGEPAGMAWIAGVTLFEGIKASKSLDGPVIADALRSLDLKAGDEAMLMIPYDGINMSKETPDGQTGQNIYAFSMISQVINGEWRSVYPDNLLEKNPLVWPIPTK